MTLHTVLDDIERGEMTLTVFDPPDPALVDDLEAYFAAQRVTIERGTATGGPDGFAVLSEGDDALTAVGLDVVAAYLSEDVGTATDTDAFDSLLGHLDDDTFATYDEAEMLTTSREIEDRAWRATEGTLYAGFQTVDALRSQQTLYETLVRTNLDAHLYATPGDETPEIDGVSLHLHDTDELRDTWFVAFDGAGNPDDKCALLAEERGEGEFHGVWTYDPAIVDRVVDHLVRRYGEDS